MDLPTVSGPVREVQVKFAVSSCRRAAERGWRMGGTLTAVTDEDAEVLIEHCHVVTSRTRLTESGRLAPPPPVGVPDRSVAAAVGRSADPVPRQAAGQS
jgi:hypothetical protein